MNTTHVEKSDFLLEYLDRDGKWIPSSLGPCVSISDACKLGEKIGWGFQDSGLARIVRRDTVVTTSTAEEIILIGDMSRKHGKGEQSSACKVKTWRIPEGVEK